MSDTGRPESSDPDAVGDEEVELRLQQLAYEATLGTLHGGTLSASLVEFLGGDGAARAGDGHPAEAPTADDAGADGTDGGDPPGGGD